MSERAEISVLNLRMIPKTEGEKPFGKFIHYIKAEYGHLVIRGESDTPLEENPQIANNSETVA